MRTGELRSGSQYHDVWSFDPVLSTWTELPSVGDVPQSRYGAGGGAVSSQRVVLSHGFSSMRYSDVLEYDLAANRWTRVRVSQLSLMRATVSLLQHSLTTVLVLTVRVVRIRAACMGAQ
jgi:hypothetical protein